MKGSIYYYNLEFTILPPMIKKKKFNLSNILFAVFLVLLIIPQTRTSLQVALNKVRIFVCSPSQLDQEDQTQLQPFTYRLATLDGTPTTLEIGKGKVTFISYWATWCPPCIAELPSIEKLYADYGDQIDFILLTNEDPETVRKFLKKKSSDLPVYFPRMETPKPLFERSIPTNYVLDKKGKIIIKETGAADWDSEKVRVVLNRLLTL